MIQNIRRASRNRATLSRGSQKPVTDCAITLADFNTPNIVLTFATPVSLSGIPQFVTDTGKLPVSAQRSGPNQVTLTYDTPGAVTSINVPERDGAIRNVSGGYVPAGTFPTV